MKYLDRESQLNTMVHPVHTLKISDFDNDLIAQDTGDEEMSPEEKNELKRKLKKQVRKTPKQRRNEEIKKDPKMQGGSPGTVFVPDVPTPDPTAEEIQEALEDEDMNQGDYLRDPENLNNLMKIGGKALYLLKLIPSLMIQPQRHGRY